MDFVYKFGQSSVCRVSQLVLHICKYKDDYYLVSKILSGSEKNPNFDLKPKKNNKKVCLPLK